MSHLISTIILFVISFVPGIYNDGGSPINRYDDQIKGHVEGTVTNVGENHKVFVGHGNISLMGDVSFEVDYYITYETQYSGTIQEGGVNTIKGPDGDELFIIAKDGTWYVNFIPDPPEVIFEVTGVIKGGTGKFKNASGKTIGTGTQLYIPGTPTIFDWTGTISY